MAEAGLFAGLAEGIWKQKQFAHEAAIEHARTVWQKSQADNQQKRLDQQFVIEQARLDAAAAKQQDQFTAIMLGLGIKSDAQKEQETHHVATEGTQDFNAQTRRLGEQSTEQWRDSEIKRNTTRNMIDEAMIPYNQQAKAATSRSADATAGLKDAQRQTAEDAHKMAPVRYKELQAKIEKDHAETRNIYQKIATDKDLEPFQKRFLQSRISLNNSHIDYEKIQGESAQALLESRGLENEFMRQHGAKMGTYKDPAEQFQKLITMKTGVVKTLGKAKEDVTRMLHTRDVALQNQADTEATIAAAGLNPSVPGTPDDEKRLLTDPIKGNPTPVSVLRGHITFYQTAAKNAQPAIDAATATATAYETLHAQIYKEEKDKGYIKTIDGKDVETGPSPVLQKQSPAKAPSLKGEHLPGFATVSRGAVPNKPAASYTVGGARYTAKTLKAIPSERRRRILSQMTPAQISQLKSDPDAR